MNVSDSVVRKLHQTLVLIADIKTQIERGPRQIKAAQTQVDAAKDALQKCKDTIRQKKMEADRKQLQLREREGKIHDWEGKMNSASNNREYQAIKEQIAADTQANNVLSDEILETLEEIDSLQNSLRDLEERLKLSESDKTKIDASVAQRIDSLKQDLVRVEGVLSDTEKELDEDSLSSYKRIVGGRGEDAMAPIEDVSCGGCYTGLPPRILDKLRMGQPMACPSCGRLLYRHE